MLIKILSKALKSTFKNHSRTSPKGHHWAPRSLGQLKNEVSISDLLYVNYFSTLPKRMPRVNSQGRHLVLSIL